MHFMMGAAFVVASSDIDVKGESAFAKAVPLKKSGVSALPVAVSGRVAGRVTYGGGRGVGGVGHYFGDSGGGEFDDNGGEVCHGPSVGGACVRRQCISESGGSLGATRTRSMNRATRCFIGGVYDSRRAHGSVRRDGYAWKTRRALVRRGQRWRILLDW